MESRVIEVTVSCKFTREIYEAFVPRLQNAIEKNGKIHVLFLMLGFQGWKAGHLWNDIHLELKHFDCIERVAIVGEAQFENGAWLFSRPFTAAIIKYFDLHDLDQAREWLRSLPI